MPQASLESLHRFHPYCARFPSEVVEAALQEYTKPGDSVFDPFCGSGTTLVASLAYKRRAIGTDIDTLAGMLSEIKCGPFAPEQYAEWRAQFAATLAKDFEEIMRAWRPGSPPRPGITWSLGSLELRIPKFPELNYWFPAQVIAALAAIAEAAHRCQEPHYERVALISLSASIISKWPNTLSYAMDVDHTRPHRRLQRFTLQRVLMTYLRRLDRSVACLGTLHTVYQGAGLAGSLTDCSRVIYPHDAREALPVIQDDSQALVMTSPPYFNAVDYPRAHRLSVCWMNGHAPEELASRRSYIGLRHGVEIIPEDWLRAHPGVGRLLPAPILDHVPSGKRLCAFFADLEAAIARIWRVLRPGGHAVFVIGDNVTKGERIASHAALTELAKDIGFLEIETRPRAIASMHRRFPIGPFGFEGPMTHEYLVVLRKPHPAVYCRGGTVMPRRFESSHLLTLHRRLCDGDRTASDELAELILDSLVAGISRQFPGADEHMRYDAVTDAFLDYCAEPQGYEERHGVPLHLFLLMACRRNMLNLLRGEARRKAREERAGHLDAISPVELDPVVGNLLQKEENEQLHQQEADLMSILHEPKDQQIVGLRLQGERRTAAFAEILGIAHLPIGVQRQEVKRAKDRIDKLLRRKGGRP